ncbi:MAG TPA: tetratricopeptide repeat protein [Pyrinomonadaceae bacterium]|nr:tetratricopeptide repeat protein [Pyrinomonadaceae bacterium]
MPARLLVLFLFTILLTVTVSAQSTSRDMAKEAEIWTRIEAISPKAIDDFKAGTTAMDAGNFDEAARLYESALRKAPQSDDILRRLGFSLIGQGKTSEGMALLEQALQENRSPENLISLATVLAYPGEGKEGSPTEKRRAFALAKEANRLPKSGDDIDYLTVLGELALEHDDLNEFRRVTEQLVARYPGVMVTHYYSALLAATDESWIIAENEMKEAERLGLPHEVAQRFYDAGIRTRATVWRYATYSLYLVGAWVVGLGLLFGIGKLMSRKTLRSIETADPTEGASSSDISLRRWYKSLINLAGFYYYISMPVVIFLVIAVAASVTYAFLMLGRIPIKLVLILGIAAIVTVYKMIRTLFIKIESEDPGRSLTYEEAPGLWELTRTVAEAVGTRPVDEIRVTPGTDLAVYEKGSYRERSQDRAQRILIVGVGILNDFPQNGFRAVLAHEYGHFSHRDTAGGDIALRVNADMMKFGYAMAASGQAVWWNIAFQFLRVYHFIFRRISHGATRLQEVLADRVAASKYGPGAFEEGLKHVVRKGVEFQLAAEMEINESASSQRALQNLYGLQVTENPEVESMVEETLNRKTSEDDTHPSPNDRFRFIRKIVLTSEQPVSGQVWDLFKDKEALTLEMTKLVELQLQGG